ncbi:MAG: magnesium protoporphyrin IX methyltransferase, partial [Proteobacteria bacterium]|nr:magnesium protoporphyrin IX methyltransferase [Pseudomonadota bacterium]
VFTVAPATPALVLMRLAGRLFPRGDRAPAIVPVGMTKLLNGIAGEPRLAKWRVARTMRVNTAFYKSQALELVRQCVN